MNTRGIKNPSLPATPNTPAYIPCPTKLFKWNQVPAAAIRPAINNRNAIPSRRCASSNSEEALKIKRIELPSALAIRRQIAPNNPKNFPRIEGRFFLLFRAAIEANDKALLLLALARRAVIPQSQLEQSLAFCDVLRQPMNRLFF